MKNWLEGELSVWPFLFCAVTAAAVVGAAIMFGLLDERRDAERARRVQDWIATSGLTEDEIERLL